MPNTLVKDDCLISIQMLNRVKCNTSITSGSSQARKECETKALIAYCYDYIRTDLFYFSTV